jgi:AcrR family transcriptional regulator
MSRGGRPRAGESEARRERVLEAAATVLRERGYRGTTTAAVAAAAGVSKESLYSWFGDKSGLFAEVVRRNAATMNAHLESAVAREEPLGDALPRLGRDLLALLVGDASVAINRAAMGELPDNGELAAVLLEHGRFTTGPLAERLLRQGADRDGLRMEDPAAAFRLFYGLLVQDTQIRVLLGGPGPSRRQIADAADRATEQLLRLLEA